jgi:hypothetical protein
VERERPRRPTLRWLRAPVVHFVLIGALLFGAQEAWRAARGRPPDPGAAEVKPPPAVRAPIVIAGGRARQLHSDFVEQFGRPPSRPELAAFVQQAADNEILEREAWRLGLDAGDRSIRARVVRKMRVVSADPGQSEEMLYRQAVQLGLADDLVIRRILREKMRILLRQDPAGATIEAADVREYVERHRDRFARAGAVTFSHVFLRASVHGDGLRRQADVTLRELRSRSLSPEASDDLSDSFPLGLEFRGWSRAAIARQFGEPFATQVLALEPGKWAGPIASPFGLHLVWVHEKIPGAMPPLEAVWPQVAREILEERAAQRLALAMERLRGLYEVRVELPDEASTANSGATSR